MSWYHSICAAITLVASAVGVIYLACAAIIALGG
jgi:hypothetical protein